jgi:hypothetical protein
MTLAEYRADLLEKFGKAATEHDAAKAKGDTVARRECRGRIKTLYREIKEVEAALAS